MNIEYITKKSFKVLGKLGQGKAENCKQWIYKLWEDANKNISEIKDLISYDINGNAVGIWGIMSDIDEKFERWGDTGKYLAGYEIDRDIEVPKGWKLMNVPEQTYIVIKCTQENYIDIFNSTIEDYIPKNNMKLIGAVHEHYLEASNPQNLELYFPIAKGNYFCQSCGMPMSDISQRGTNSDGSINNDYCVYCYKDGKFTFDGSMEEMIEFCIPMEVEAKVYPDADTARENLLKYYPTLKRWSKI